jgi:hypothetical protein
LIRRWLALVGAAAALAITLVPIGEPFPGQGLVHPTPDVRDFILNLALLAPVGAGLRLRGWRPGALLACVLALSGGIELLQLLLPIGRDASLVDIVANTAGAGVAAWVVPRISWGLGASAKEARWLAATALLAWGAQAVMTAWALQRDIPVAAQYYGQWAHVFGGMVPLAGVVTAFTIQGRPVPDDAVPNTDALRAALAHDDTVTLQVAATDLGPSVGRAQVAGVTNGAGDLLAGVERDGCRIRFRLRTRGERLGLRPLSVMLPTSCRLESGVTAIAGRATHASLAIAARWDGEVRQATLALAPSLGWRLFVPPRWRGGGWDLLGSIAWLAVWGAPLALWLQAAWPRNLARAALLYVVGLLGGAALVAAASGLTVGTPGDVVGVALGWWLGGLGGRRVRPSRQVNLA